MTVSRSIARSREVWREQGPRALLREIAAATVYRRMLVYARHVEDSLELAFPDALEVRRLRNVDEMLRLRPGTPAQQIEARLAAGHICLIAELDGVPSICTWIARARAEIEYLSCDVILDDDELYSYDTYVRPEARGNQLNLRATPARSRAYAELGARRVISTTHLGNVPAIRMQNRQPGARVIGTVGCLRLGDYRHPVVRMHPGERPVRLVPSRRPT